MGKIGHNLKCLYFLNHKSKSKTDWIFKELKDQTFGSLNSNFLISALLNPENLGQSWPIFQKIEISNHHLKEFFDISDGVKH